MINNNQFWIIISRNIEIWDQGVKELRFSVFRAQLESRLGSERRFDRPCYPWSYYIIVEAWIICLYKYPCMNFSVWGPRLSGLCSRYDAISYARRYDEERILWRNWNEVKKKWQLTPLKGLVSLCLELIVRYKYNP